MNHLFGRVPSICLLHMLLVIGAVYAEEAPGLVTDTFKGPWTFAHASPEESEAYLREYPTVYAIWPALNFAADKGDLSYQAHKVLRVEFRKADDGSKYAYRARAVIEVTMSRSVDPPDELADGISPFAADPPPEVDPLSDAATPDQLGDVMDSEVAQASAKAMQESLDEVFSSEEALVDVLQDLYGKAVATGAGDNVLPPLLGYMVEVSKAIDKVKQAKSLIESMEEAAWSTAGSLFDDLLDELDALNSGPTGRSVLSVPSGGNFRSARDDLVRSVNNMRTDVQTGIRQVEFERNRRELARANAPKSDTPVAANEFARESSPTAAESQAPDSSQLAASSRPTESMPSGGDDNPGVRSFDAEGAFIAQSTGDDTAPHKALPTAANTTSAIPEKPDDKSIQLSIRKHQLDYFEEELAKADTALETARAGRAPQYVTIYETKTINYAELKQCEKSNRSIREQAGRKVESYCPEEWYRKSYNTKRKSIHGLFHETYTPMRDIHAFWLAMHDLKRSCSTFFQARQYDPSWNIIFEFSEGQIINEKTRRVAGPFNGLFNKYRSFWLDERKRVARQDPKYVHDCKDVLEWERVLLTEALPVDASGQSHSALEESLEAHFSDISEIKVVLSDTPELPPTRSNISYVRSPEPLSLKGAPVDLWPPTEMRAVAQEFAAIKAALSAPEEAFAGLSEAELDAPLLEEVTGRITSLQPAAVLRTSPLPHIHQPDASTRALTSTPATITTDTAQARSGAIPQSTDELFTTFFGTDSAPAAPEQNEPPASATKDIETDDLFDKFWD